MTHPNKPIKVCYQLLNAYSLFNPNIKHNFGGIEFRGHLFTTGLAKYDDFDIHVVVRDHQQPTPETYNNLHLIPHPGYPAQENWQSRYRESIAKSIRFKKKFPYFQINRYHPKLLYKVARLGITRLWKLLKPSDTPPVQIGSFRILPEKVAVYHHINADIYCAHGVNNWSAELAAYCATVNKPFILLIALDFDSNRLAPKHEYALHQAAHLVAQTSIQAKEMKTLYGLDSTIIKNPIDTTITKAIKPTHERNIILWVGKSNTTKNPLAMLELIKNFPENTFIMVMNRSDENLFETVNSQKPENLTIYEYIPITEIEDLFAQARIFVSTSLLEGFPNTFLQAAKYNVPILSLHVDPDGMLSHHQAGICANGDMNTMLNNLKTWISNDQIVQDYGEKARQYVVQHHDLSEKIRQLAEILRQTIRQST